MENYKKIRIVGRGKLNFSVVYYDVVLLNSETVQAESQNFLDPRFCNILVLFKIGFKSIDLRLNIIEFHLLNTPGLIFKIYPKPRVYIYF